MYPMLKGTLIDKYLFYSCSAHGDNKYYLNNNDELKIYALHLK